VDDNHSGYELNYKKRWISIILQNAIKEHPIVVLTGARQVGKSTLLQNESPFKSWNYQSLDDFDILEQAEQNPEALWAGEKRIVLDEVQKSVKLLSAVKIAVDTYCKDCRFVLSGSANLLLMKKVSESLAGRAVYFNLLPLTMGEINSKPPNNILKYLFQKKINNITDNKNMLQNQDIDYLISQIKR